jgi:hypothetical protein
MSDQTVSNSGGTVWRWSVETWVLVGLFGGLTLAGVAVSTGIAGTGVLEGPSEPNAGINVPFYVYLYATLGALGYIFTKVMMASDTLAGPGGTGDLVSMGMRIPAAWVLGAGFYLLLVQGGADPVGDPHLFATVAFLVGLYVNVAIKSLGSLADRLLGRGTRS